MVQVRKEFPNGLIVRTYEPKDEENVQKLWMLCFFEMTTKFMHATVFAPKVVLGVSMLAAVVFALTGPYAWILAVVLVGSYALVSFAAYMYSRNLVSVAIKEGMEKDMSQIKRFWLETNGTKCGRHFLVGELKGRIVGCAALREDDSPSTSKTSGSIWRMCVDRSTRRKGVAKHLLTEIETLAVAMGYDYLRVTTGNPDATAFYRKQPGYSVIGSLLPFSSYTPSLAVFDFERILKKTKRDE